MRIASTHKGENNTMRQTSKLTGESYFPEETVDADGNKLNRFGIHWLDQSTYYTSYYYNRCLAVIEAIFYLGEIPVNLHNFDSLEFTKD